MNVWTSFQTVIIKETGIESIIGTFAADVNGRQYDVSFIVDEDYDEQTSEQRAAYALKLLSDKIMQATGANQGE